MEAPLKITHLYRYERLYESLKLVLERHLIIRETEKSHFIEGRKAPILKEGTKRFAYPTEAEALANFIARTKVALDYQQRALNRSVWYLQEALGQSGQEIPECLKPVAVSLRKKKRPIPEWLY